MGGGFSLQGEWDRYNGTYGGYIGSYGGSSAGTGTGGVDGVGPVIFHTDGNVSTGNFETTHTLPDGTVVTTKIEDGLRSRTILRPDGSITQIDETRGEWVEDIYTQATIVEFTTYPDGSTQKKVIGEDGFYACQTRHANGTVVTTRVLTDKSIEVTTERAGETLTTVSRNGSFTTITERAGVTTNVTKYPDGTEIKRIDGPNDTRVIIKYPDGSMRTESRSDSFIPDGKGNTYANFSYSHRTSDDRDFLITGSVTQIPDPENGGFLYHVQATSGVREPGAADIILNPQFNRVYLNTTLNIPAGGVQTLEEFERLGFPKEHYVGAPNGFMETILRQISRSQDPYLKSGILGIETDTETLNVRAQIGTDQGDIISGNGLIYGGDGDDTLTGGSERDLLLGGSGNDVLDGGSNEDRLEGGEGNDVLEGGQGNDLVSGQDGNDTLLGGDGSDSVSGGNGDDVLVASSGADTLDGGNGLDFVSFEQSASGVVANLTDHFQDPDGGPSQVYFSIEGLSGSAYNDNLTGDAQSNILVGQAGDDMLFGLAGRDVLMGGFGADTLNGGADFDIVSYAQATAGVVVNLSSGAENTGEAAGDTYLSIEGVFGSTFADVITGNGLSNVLEGNAGDDALDGNGGGDTLLGGAGNDRLYSKLDADILDGGSGWDTVSYSKSGITSVQIYLWDVSRNKGAAKGDVYAWIEAFDGTRLDDVLEGDEFANTFWGDDGRDSLKGGAGADTLSGGGGDDKLEGGIGADRLNGGDGWDTVSYWGASAGVLIDLENGSRNTGDAQGDTYVGIDVFDGSTHGDTLEGANATADTFWGDAGHDLLKGRGNTDNLMGGSGDDQLMGGTAGDRLDGGEGFDFALYTEATARVVVDLAYASRSQGEAQNDMFLSIEGVKGSAFGDEIYGNDGFNTLEGQGDDDRLEGRSGGDQLDGGNGRDHAVYWGASAGVRASLLNPSLNTGDAAGDQYVSIEGLEGSGYGDMLQGDGAGNTLYGYGGNDELLGEGGNDYIEGGDGADVISGGEGLDWLLGNAGADVFRFDTRASAFNVDTLADFNLSQGDRIALETGAFGFAAVVYEDGYTLNGTLKSSAFVVGQKAATVDQRIVYDQATGALYYDKDGVNGTEQVQFAKVAAGTALTTAHFELFTL